MAALRAAAVAAAGGPMPFVVTEKSSMKFWHCLHSCDRVQSVQEHAQQHPAWDFRTRV